ncbi:MAG TPA: lipid A biosynthesis acyltransferase [Nitrospirae bacterium]|nr:lipid A biosynthesis acyltransferase [Nitrospirota bacterium]
MKRILFFLKALIIQLATYPLALLPRKPALHAGSLIGLLAYHLWRSRRDIAIKNLTLTISNSEALNITDSREVVKENFKNLGRSLMEVIKIYHGRGGEIIESVVITGKENYIKALQKGRGIIVITGHCGNWELLALAASCRLTPISVVARPINNPYLNRFVERIRTRYGNRVIYKGGALREILRELKAGRPVGILMDQGVLPSEGVLVDFLGRPAWTIKTPAVIARKTGTPVLPVFIKRNGERHIMEIHREVKLSENPDPEEAIREDTRTFTSYIEAYIRENPTEWLWIHRRWKRTEKNSHILHN